MYISVSNVSFECELSSRVRGKSLNSVFFLFFFQAEDGIRDLVRSRGLGDVYKRQVPYLRRALDLSGQVLESDPQYFESQIDVAISKSLSLIHI